MASPNAVYITLNDEQAERLDAAVQRYGKKSRAAVMAEVFELYFPLWEQLEDQRLETLTGQIDNALGKASAPAKPQRARKAS